MANFKQVNREIRKVYPNIEVIRGVGYVYFSDLSVESIMIHPTSTSTEDMIRVCLDHLTQDTEEGKTMNNILRYELESEVDLLRAKAERAKAQGAINRSEALHIEADALD